MNVIYFHSDNPPRADLLDINETSRSFGLTPKQARSMAKKLNDAGFAFYKTRTQQQTEEQALRFGKTYYGQEDLSSVIPLRAEVNPPVNQRLPSRLTKREPEVNPPESIWDDGTLSKIEALYDRLLSEKEAKADEIRLMVDEKESKIEKIESAFARERGALELVISSITNELSYFKNRAIKMEREVSRKEKEIELLEADTVSRGSVVPVESVHSLTEGVQLPSFPTQ